MFQKLVKTKERNHQEIGKHEESDPTDTLANILDFYVHYCDVILLSQNKEMGLTLVLYPSTNIFFYFLTATEHV